MPLADKNINIASGTPTPEQAKASLLTDDCDILLLPDNETEALTPNGAVHDAESGSPQDNEEASGEQNDTDAGQDIAVDESTTTSQDQMSLDLQPPPPMPMSSPAIREASEAAEAEEAADEAERDVNETEAEEPMATNADALAVKPLDETLQADNTSPSSPPSPKAFLLPVVALGSKYEVPVTSETQLFSVIREVAELAVPPESADALGEVEAILYHDNVPLNPDSTVGELPEGSVLHFHLNANTTAKMSASTSFFPAQLRGRRATSHAEAGLLPTFRAPAPSWAHLGQSQVMSQGPMLMNANGQSMLGMSHMASHHRASLASSAPFYIGGNVSVAPRAAAAAARRRSSQSAAGGPAQSHIAASRGSILPSGETVGTTSWLGEDGSPCYTSIQVEARRIPIRDTRECPPPANPERLARVSSGGRLRSVRPSTIGGPNGAPLMPGVLYAPNGARSSLAYSMAPQYQWASPHAQSTSLPPSVLPFQALQPPLPRLQSTASAPAAFTTIATDPHHLPQRASQPQPRATSPHQQQHQQQALPASQSRGTSVNAGKISRVGSSVDEEMRDRADRVADSTQNDDAFSVVYVHLPSTTANAFGEEPDSEGGQPNKDKTGVINKKGGRLGDAGGNRGRSDNRTVLVPPSSPRRTEMRRLRFDRNCPVGALREMFDVPMRLPLYAGPDMVEDERKSMNALNLEGYTVFSFTNKRPSSALIAAPYLNSPVASPPPGAFAADMAVAPSQARPLSLSDLSHHTHTTPTPTSTSPSSASVPGGFYAVMPSAGAYWSAAPAIQPVLVAGSDGRLVSMAPLQLEQPRHSLVLSPIHPGSTSGSVFYDGHEEDLFSPEMMRNIPQQQPHARRQSGSTPDQALWASTTLSSHRRSSAGALAQNTTQPFVADNSEVTGASVREERTGARRSTISAVLQDAEEQGNVAGSVQRYVFPPASPTSQAADEAAAAERHAHHHHLAPLEAEVHACTVTNTHHDQPHADAAHSSAGRGQNKTSKSKRHSSSSTATEDDPSRPPRTLEPLSATQTSPRDEADLTTMKTNRGSSFGRFATGSVKRVRDGFYKLKSHPESSPTDTVGPHDDTREAPVEHAAPVTAATKKAKKTKKTKKAKEAKKTPETAVAETQEATTTTMVKQDAPADSPSSQNTTAAAVMPVAAFPSESERAVLNTSPRPRVSFHEQPAEVHNDSIASSNGVIDINNLSTASSDVQTSPDSELDAPAPVRVMAANGTTTPLIDSLRTSRSSSVAGTPRVPPPAECGVTSSEAFTATQSVPLKVARRKTSDREDTVRPVQNVITTPPRKRSATLAPDQVAPLRSIEVGSHSANSSARGTTRSPSTSSMASGTDGGGDSAKKAKKKSLKRHGTPIIELPGFLKRKKASGKKSRTPSASRTSQDVLPLSEAEAEAPQRKVSTTKAKKAKKAAPAPGSATEPMTAAAPAGPRQEDYVATSITSFDGDDATDATLARKSSTGSARRVRKGSDVRETAAADQHDATTTTPMVSQQAVPLPPPDTSLSLGPSTLSRTFQPLPLAHASQATQSHASRRAETKSESSGDGSAASSTHGAGSPHQNHSVPTATAVPKTWDASQSPTSILVPTRHSTSSPSNSAPPVKYMTRSNSFRRGTQQQITSPTSPTLRSPNPQERHSSGSTPSSAERSTASDPQQHERFSVDSTGSNGRMRISLCDPLDSSKINFGVPVFTNCPVRVLRQWLREVVVTRLEGKDVAIPRFHNRLEYGVFCGDVRVIDEALTFGEATGGKNDCVFSLRKLVDDRNTGLAQYGSFDGISKKRPSE